MWHPGNCLLMYVSQHELCTVPRALAGAACFACGILSVACSPVFKGIPTVVCNLSDRV